MLSQRRTEERGKRGTGRTEGRGGRDLQPSSRPPSLNRVLLIPYAKQVQGGCLYYYCYIWLKQNPYSYLQSMNIYTTKKAITQYTYLHTGSNCVATSSSAGWRARDLGDSGTSPLAKCVKKEKHDSEEDEDEMLNKLQRDDVCTGFSVHLPVVAVAVLSTHLNPFPFSFWMILV